MNRLKLDELHLRMVRAEANGEHPQVLHRLMLDTAEYVREAGYAQQAAEILQTASTLVPMFGMHEEMLRQNLPWWKRRKFQPPDYDAIYRSYTYEESA